MCARRAATSRARSRRHAARRRWRRDRPLSGCGWRAPWGRRTSRPSKRPYDMAVRTRPATTRRARPPLPAGDVVGMLAGAEALAEREPALVSLAVPMARATEAFGRPLLVAVMGEFTAGKSSLVNALAGGDVAPVGVTPTTAPINVHRYGPGGGRDS